MSLIMMINKIQDASDLESFLRIPGQELDKIVQNSPKHVMDVIAAVLESLCFKIDVSEEERAECVRKVRRRRMGYLFENMEHISLQEERRKTEEQRRKMEEQCRKTEEERRKTEEQCRKTEEERRRADIAEEKLRLAEETIRRLQEAQRAYTGSR